MASKVKDKQHYSAGGKLQCWGETTVLGGTTVQGRNRQAPQQPYSSPFPMVWVCVSEVGTQMENRAWHFMNTECTTFARPQEHRQAPTKHM